MFEDYREEVRIYLKNVVKELKAKYGTLNPTYKMPLILLAENLETFFKASEIVKREGITIIGGRGLMEHPANKVKDNAQVRIEKYLESFGLTPKSQKHLITEVDDTSELIESLIN